ncbi:MAG: glycosyltransferase family 2 protein [Verrucomicrobia bacterium]|nr:glycosyltransferase family 2 protein [Verrucomicrobiota bacterium]MCG2679649.1 glycosyltransferase family 2 protein [Kiritimatiellia bacterium]MBU4247950.1 glycosyltransferase family 2 protein [Verrucomicrobiota bacterium]MBU4291447.1 glycosyltransferase family 2 protein [Verrucomicrobiota bacterium]MBU4428373.1 glycosyltransferase family 2 protein [Verrucomicrobiota bacterium]
MGTPVVSVIIPAYNHERYVGLAIESVLAQTFGDFELVVIDDGSTDRTWDVIQGFHDSRLIRHRQENQDAYNTLNSGLHLARGRFTAILNSDDVYPPGRLERLLAEQKAADAVCVFTDVQPIDAGGRAITDPGHPWNLWHQKNRHYYLQCGNLAQAFLKGNFMVTTSNLFLTAEAVRQTGDFCALRFLHDYDYIFRIMLAFPGRVRYLADEQLLFYRVHGGNTLGQGAVLAREQDQQVIRKYLMAFVPSESRPLVQAGVERLIELEQELLIERNRSSAASRLYRLKTRMLCLIQALRAKFRKPLT